MRRTFIFITIMLIFLVAACNRPGSTEPVLITSTPRIEDTSTPTPDEPTVPPPTMEEPTPTEQDPTPQPPPPTADIVVILEGERIPLYKGGAKVIIHEVGMIDLNTGWGISKDDNGIDHVLRTTDGGYRWRDITPPQPIDPDYTWMDAEVRFGDPNTGWVTYTGSDLVWSTNDGGKSNQRNPVQR